MDSAEDPPYVEKKYINSTKGEYVAVSVIVWTILIEPKIESYHGLKWLEDYILLYLYFIIMFFILPIMSISTLFVKFHTFYVQMLFMGNGSLMVRATRFFVLFYLKRDSIWQAGV